MATGRVKALRNTSNFEKIPEGGGCRKMTAFVSNMVDLEIDARPDWQPEQITNDFCDAGVLYDFVRGHTVVLRYPKRSSRRYRND